MAEDRTMEFVADFASYGAAWRREYTEFKREHFRAFRILRPGVCYQHLDQEPCAECFVRLD